MEKNDMKNIVVLKNIPSNLVDEAILIIKGNKNARKLEHIYTANCDAKEKMQNGDYIIKEAESVIQNYILNTEEKIKNKKPKNAEKKYKILKIYSIVISIFMSLLFIKVLL